MDYDQIKLRLAPCGLHCGKCYAFSDGEIKQYSQKLALFLGEFDVYAQRFVGLLNEPIFEKYPEFKQVLKYFTKAECDGCRKENCKLLKSCKVKSCSEIKGVDFCFKCDEFPCNKTGFDDHLHDRSVAINRRMKDVGVEVYYNEIKDKSRY